MSVETIHNKVTASGIIAFDLLAYKPTVEVVGLDIKQLLYMEMIIKEKEFRIALAQLDFTAFYQKAVAVYCSVDAIIPQWVYMVLADKLYDQAAHFKYSTVEALTLELWESQVQQADLTPFKDQKVVVRANPDIPDSLYIEASKVLKPVVKSLLYGEIGMPKVIFK
ncbi:DUF2480 family protein [Myroides sp. DF42-4-2]|uniref:DUF2480 family protein n=1 Tax=unclassified Myroides TaxID=2642485 RepID=UPI0025778BDA|nr:DUF2480 family protein [Myroides sp. DF42-4-2]MDM1408820.1 DUF2480 family protein [Myroides sp. DF42-4-2]